MKNPMRCGLMKLPIAAMHSDPPTAKAAMIANATTSWEPTRAVAQ